MRTFKSECRSKADTKRYPDVAANGDNIAVFRGGQQILLFFCSLRAESGIVEARSLFINSDT